MAVTVSGWKTLPMAGDQVLEGSETDIKKAIANRELKAEIDESLVDVEAINSNRRQERELRALEVQLAGEAKDRAPAPKLEDTGPKELKLVIKADVSGSAEAVAGALNGMGNHLAVAKVVSSTVGEVSESDVMLAKAAEGELQPPQLSCGLLSQGASPECCLLTLLVIRNYCRVLCQSTPARGGARC
jgi:translation initiation factor IF-2